jgi:hypothetical protein
MRRRQSFPGEFPPKLHNQATFEHGLVKVNICTLQPFAGSHGRNVKTCKDSQSASAVQAFHGWASRVY